MEDFTQLLTNTHWTFLFQQTNVKTKIECRCVCGNVRSVLIWNLRRGKSRSCGCVRNPKRTHGMSHYPEYAIWCGMLSRCNNPNATHYEHYGKQGIKVCPQWRKFENFYRDLGPRPTPKHTLERENGKKDYDPTNCKWATQTEQMENTSATRRITAFGKTQSIKAWAREVGMKYLTLYHRIRTGMEAEKALTLPKFVRKNRFTTERV